MTDQREWDRQRLGRLDPYGVDGEVAGDRQETGRHPPAPWIVGSGVLPGSGEGLLGDEGFRQSPSGLRPVVQGMRRSITATALVALATAGATLGLVALLGSESDENRNATAASSGSGLV
jgi:hypothetical protein